MRSELYQLSMNSTRARVMAAGDCRGAPVSSSHSSVAKKLSTTALYHHMPARLMLASMPWVASTVRYA